MVKRIIKAGKEDWAMIGVLLFAVAAVVGVFISPLYLGEATFEPDYPFAVEDRIYQPVWGTINCQHTGSWTAIEQPQSEAFYEYTFPYLVGTGTAIDYQCTYIGGCKIISVSGTCEGWGRDFHYSVTDDTGYTTYQLPLMLGYGDTAAIKMWCVRLHRTPPEAVDIEIKGEQAKLKVESYGYTKAGWLAGSDNCKLVSVDAATLKEMQDKSADELKGIEQIPMGTTKTIIVGWRDSPTFGTVNPCGEYNGRDVACNALDGIYSLKKIYTEGNINYWTVDALLKSYAEDNTMCCCAGDCAVGYVCEDYQCKEEAVICEFGQCPWGISQCEQLGGCFQEGGKYYLRQAYCDADKCCQYTEREVMCCRDYCDAMSTPDRSFYCEYDVGCVEVTFLKECPAGCCCIEGGEYKIQNCLDGLQCCMDEIPSNPYMGTCKESCEGVVPPDSCYKECIDYHNYGFTDYTGRIRCQIECWIKSHLGWFIVGGGIIVLLIGFKVFMRVNPHMRVLSKGYKAVRR